MVRSGEADATYILLVLVTAAHSFRRRFRDAVLRAVLRVRRKRSAVVGGTELAGVFVQLLLLRANVEIWSTIFRTGVFESRDPTMGPAGRKTL